MDPWSEKQLWLTRRHFFGLNSAGIGVAALATLLGRDLRGADSGGETRGAGLPGLPHFAPKAKRIIYLFQSGAPSQMDLFDPKPDLLKQRGEDLPDSIRKGQRLTTMTSGQKKF